MRKEAKDKEFIKKPVYKGGPKALKKFIGENLRYPKEALENKVEGTVYLNYDINYKGEVTDARVIKGIGHGCDEEAVRLVKLLKYEVPRNRGVRVVFHKNIQIHFRLPKVKEKPVQVQYNYVSSPGKTADQTEQKKSATTFTITFNQ
ncbi:MAG: hypothetical protein Kow0027_13680 [Saprospiraceae bacterium]|jgi:protein TonB|nr:hypothetical protein [Saprospirales bacterium]RME10015.1 MAG: energy transducer TonB [Bacteroidota bacterium]